MNRKKNERNDKKVEESKKKNYISFPKKVWYSITKFEQYPTMATEGIAKAISYLITMTIIVTIFAVIGSILKMHKTMDNLAQYIEQNIPNFTFSDGNISMDIEHPIIIKDFEYNAIDKVVINPLAEDEETKNNSETEETVEGTTIFFFKDEILLKAKIDDEHIQRKEYTYSEFFANYTDKDITSFDKTQFVEYIKSDKMLTFYSRYTGNIFIVLVLTGIIYAFLDSFRIAIFGWVTAWVARIKLKFSAIYNMSIYAFTLPMILNIIYLIINYFTDFTIKYFQVAYSTIAYIYLAASIFILKDDFIKKMQEVMKIKQEQKNVREEIKKQEEKPEDEKEEDKKEQKKKEEDDNDEDEPQGSEA